MVNTIAPLRMGELVRAYLVGHYDRLGVDAAVGTIVLEKLFDVGSLIVVFVILAALTPLPDWANAAAIASGLGLAVGVAGTICLVVAEQRVLDLIRFFEKRIPIIDRMQVSNLAASFVDGLRSIQSPRTLFWVVVWSAVLWLGAALTLAFGFLAVGISLTPEMVFFLLVVTNLGMAVPSPRVRWCLSRTCRGRAGGVWCARNHRPERRDRPSRGSFWLLPGWWDVLSLAGSVLAGPAHHRSSRNGASCALSEVATVALWYVAIQALALAIAPLAIQVFVGLRIAASRIARWSAGSL